MRLAHATSAPVVSAMLRERARFPCRSCRPPLGPGRADGPSSALDGISTWGNLRGGAGQRPKTVRQTAAKGRPVMHQCGGARSLNLIFTLLTNYRDLSKVSPRTYEGGRE